MEYWPNPYDKEPPYFVSSTSIGESRSLTENSAGSRLSKLPPRSRSGCWTCRNRKVKFVSTYFFHAIYFELTFLIRCDERRPKCRQCIRLDHECDYSPKLVFKDETLKVVDKYVEPPAIGGSWNSGSEQLLLSDEPDSLPPFTHLSTDEDWQQKATYQPPGTYYVVANSDSFSDSPDYKASSVPDSQLQYSAHPDLRGKTNVSVDHATVILGTFEGGSKKPLVDPPTTTDQPRYSLPFRPSHPSNSRPEYQTVSLKVEETTMHPNELSESTLIRHWRSFVRKQLFYMCDSADVSSIDLVDLVEDASRSYLPLRHAILALCALSLGIKQDRQTIQALEHYTEAIEALKESHTEQELVSDRLFLTHYILLIYEISATEKCWHHHMESLKAIIARRRAASSHEPLASVVLSICTIDVTALISCSGDGVVILDHALREPIPTSEDFRKAVPFLPNNFMTSLRWDILESSYNFLHSLVRFWAMLGEISFRIRQEVQAQNDANIASLSATTFRHWHPRIVHIREAIKQQRHMRESSRYLSANEEQQTASEPIRQIHEQGMLLYHSSLIYSYTNMWPIQSADLDAQENDWTEVQQSITSILAIAMDLVDRGALQRRCAVLALLLAGQASRDRNERVTALNLLKTFEKAALGCNTEATRRLLQAVLIRQDELRARGLPEHVDWILTAQELGLQHLVNFGL